MSPTRPDLHLSVAELEQEQRAALCQIIEAPGLVLLAAIRARGFRHLGDAFENSQELWAMLLGAQVAVPSPVEACARSSALALRAFLLGLSSSAIESRIEGLAALDGDDSNPSLTDFCIALVLALGAALDSGSRIERRAVRQALGGRAKLIAKLRVAVTAEDIEPLAERFDELDGELAELVRSAAPGAAL